MNMTKEILRIPLVVDPTVMHGQEAGKALAALDLAIKTTESPYYGTQIHIDSIWERTELIEGYFGKKDFQHGKSYRPESITDIYVHNALIQEMARTNPWNHIEDHVDVAYQIAKECLDNRAFTGDRIQHEAIGNAGYLNAYLVPAGFVAWGVSWRKAITIFHAALLTKSRAFFLAMAAGILAYTIKGLRPPLFALAAPFLLPVLLFKSFRRVIRFRNRQDSARLGFLRVIKAARKDCRAFGYGNFSEAVEEYFEEYLGENPNGQTYSEAWADKSHAEFMEWDVTLGKEKAKELRSIYWGWLKKAQEPWLAGAMSAHMACLSTLFRTEAASIGEDFLIALIEGHGPSAVSRHFQAYYKAHKGELEARERLWKTNLAVHLALIDGTEEQKLQTLRLRPITLEGQLKVPKNISPEVAGAIKQAYEWDIEHHGGAERVYRYWWLLRYFHDTDEPIWRERALELSPKRMKMEIERHPVKA